jgi:hypothetical protein
MPTQKICASFYGWKDGDILIQAENVYTAFNNNTELAENWLSTVASPAELMEATDEVIPASAHCRVIGNRSSILTQVRRSSIGWYLAFF